MCNPNLFGAILAKMTRDQGLDNVALVQLGATLAATSPPIRIAEEYAVLDCISGGRSDRRRAARARLRRQYQLRHHADGSARALARGDRSHAQGVDREGILRLEREILSAAESESVAAAGAGPASAALGAGRRELVDVGLLPRPQSALRLSQLFRRQIGQQRDGPLLGARRRQRQGRKPISRVIPPGRRRRRNRPQGRGGIRQARRIFLSQAPAPADLSDRAARLRRLQEPVEHPQVGNEPPAVRRSLDRAQAAQSRAT